MRVLYYYQFDFFYPIRCGADVIANGHLDYFRARGWDVDCIVRRTHRAWSERPFMEKYPWLCSAEAIEFPWPDYSLGGMMLQHQRAKDMASFRRAFARGADLFFTNYVYTAPLIQCLAPGCKTIVETHDVFTHLSNLVARGPEYVAGPVDAALDEFNLCVEREVCGLFDGVICLSPADKELLDVAGEHKVHYVPPTLPPNNVQVARRAQRCQDYDLLFVGSYHAPNLRGMAWFYEHVYAPFLGPRGIRLAIAGRVCKGIRFRDPHIDILGEMDDLTPLFDHSRAVINPMLEGTGISIKTLESLAQSRAIISTAPGWRGMPRDDEAYVSIDMVNDPRGSAQRILDLLAAPYARRRLQEAARAYYFRHFGPERHHAAMDRVMAAVGLNLEAVGARPARRAVA